MIVIPHVGKKIPSEGFINFGINGRASPMLRSPARLTDILLLPPFVIV